MREPVLERKISLDLRSSDRRRSVDSESLRRGTDRRYLPGGRRRTDRGLRPGTAGSRKDAVPARLVSLGSTGVGKKCAGVVARRTKLLLVDCLGLAPRTAFAAAEGSNLFSGKRS